jgi:hypothetical protein
MKHSAPKVLNENEGPGLNDFAAKLARAVASRNPVAAAIYEECEPEINEALRGALGNQHAGLAEISRTAARAHRIATNAAAKMAAVKEASK